MNKVIFTFSILISAGLGYVAGKNSDSPTVATQPREILAQKAIQVPHNVAKSSQAIVENNFQINAQLSSNEQKKPASPPATKSTTQNEIDAIKAEYDAKQRSESFTNWLTQNQKSKPWFDLGVEMRGRFDVEEIDHEWANREEGHIQLLFSQKEELSGIAVKSTACKSTQCQITISVVNQDHANEMAMAITKVLGAEKFSHIIIDNQAQQGESTFYIARDEKGFEFN